MTWQPIVVGVDGSPESARAAALGAYIAERAGTSCYLIHAAIDYWSTVSVPEIGIAVSELDRAAEVAARRLVEHSLEEAVPARLRGTLDVQVGRAPVVLVEEARRRHAEVVVLGGKRRRALARIGGSTITHLVRLGSVPVLAVDGASPTIRRVLVAVDLSYAAKPAIDTAERWAALFGAELRVLHCSEPMPVVPGITIPMADDEFFRTAQQAAEAAIRPLITYPGADVVVRRGRAAATIAVEAAQWRADLIILGSHGKGWVDRLLIGSTSERLLQVLPAPTLVVPVAHPAAPARDVGLAIPAQAHAVR
jgi:nucleotide-binding universal stress UspA family protein